MSQVRAAKMATSKRIIYFVVLVLATEILGTPALEKVNLGVAVAQAQTLPEPVRRGYTLLDRGLVNDAIAAFEQARSLFRQQGNQDAVQQIELILRNLQGSG